MAKSNNNCSDIWSAAENGASKKCCSINSTDDDQRRYAWIVQRQAYKYSTRIQVIRSHKFLDQTRYNCAGKKNERAMEKAIPLFADQTGWVQIARCQFACQFFQLFSRAVHGYAFADRSKFQSHFSTAIWAISRCVALKHFQVCAQYFVAFHCSILLF